jgi:hypothetical protein
MTPNKIRDAAAQLEATRERYLRARGWEHTCDNPASTWLWQKALPDGRVVLVSREWAIEMQERSDSISLKHWPKPERVPA